MPIYSDSRLSMYEECPFKYKLRYRDNIKRDIEGVEGFLGSRVHETLKKCYDDLRLTRLDTLSDLLAYYNKIWQENWNDSIIIVKADLTQAHYRALGEKMIETYYNRYAPFDQDITMGTELGLNFPLDDDSKYRMRGYIDRLSRTQDGTYEIHDYKTSAHLPGQKTLTMTGSLAYTTSEFKRNGPLSRISGLSGTTSPSMRNWFPTAPLRLSQA